MHMTTRVAVAGASGYAGGEVLRLLLGHPEVEIGALTAGSNAGEPLGALQPHLVPLADRVLAETTVDDPGRVTTWSSSALPHGQSGALAAELGDDTARGRLRRRLPAPRRGPVGAVLRRRRTPAPGPTACPSCPASATCSRGARRIAVPGCYPTVSTLALAPGGGRRAGGRPTSWWSPPPAPAAPARRAKPHLLGSEVMGNASAYGVGGTHRHTPEIVQNLSAAAPTARCGSASRRSSCRCRAASSPPARRRSRRGATPTEVREAYLKAYAAEPFVHVLPEGQWPQTKAVHGSNAVPPAGDRRRGGRPARGGRARSTTSPRAPPAARSSP